MHPADAAERGEGHGLHAALVVLHGIEVEEVEDELDKHAPEGDAQHLLDDVGDTTRRPRQHRSIQLLGEVTIDQE